MLQISSNHIQFQIPKKIPPRNWYNQPIPTSRFIRFAHRTSSISYGGPAEAAPVARPLLPSMADIVGSSRVQNLDLRLESPGPFFRVTARMLGSDREIGRAEGVVRVWWEGKILHLDSIRLRRESLGVERSVFGVGLLIGAVAVRHGYDCGCKVAQLLAINDSDLYHSKLVRFYTRVGFKEVHEVKGGSLEDLQHMLVWGGKGTRMDANIEELLVKWSKFFKPHT